MREGPATDTQNSMKMSSLQASEGDVNPSLFFRNTLSLPHFYPFLLVVSFLHSPLCLPSSLSPSFRLCAVIMT